MSELSGADRLLLSALSADGAEAIAAALGAHDPAADCPACGVGDGSHALGCPRIPASTAGQQPTGAALIRAILGCGAFVPATQAELLRIAETLEIAEAMDALAPAAAPDEMAQQQHVAGAAPFSLGGSYRAKCSCGWTGDVWFTETHALHEADEHAATFDAPPASEPERAGRDAMREAQVEAVAEAIYDAMREHDPVGRKVPWVPGGNSLKQDDARRYARAALACEVNRVR